MHTHAPCLTLAEGLFRLNTPPRHAPDGRRGVWPALALRPPQGEPWRRRSPFARDLLLAVLLHTLCFGLLLAHASYSWEKLGPAGKGLGGGTGIVVGNVTLSRLSVPGAPAASGREAQAQRAPESSATAVLRVQEPRAQAEREKDSAEDPLQTHAPPQENKAAPLQAAQPKQKKQRETPRRAMTGAGPETGTQSAASGAAQDGQIADRTAGAGAPAAGSVGQGFAGDGGAVPGGLAAFGGSDGPSFKRFVKPEYPAQARRQGITGKVLLRIHITSEGVADRVEVVQSAHELLSKSALEAVKRSTFHPLRRDGKTASCWTLLPISFTLEQG